MRSIGFRCWPDQVAYVVLEGSQSNPVLIASDCQKAPTSMSRPGQLQWLRREAFEVLDQFGVDSAAFKTAERMTKKPSLTRAEFEGVLQEACLSHSRALNAEPALKTQLAKRIGFEGKARYVTNALGESGLDSLDSAKFSEAALAALSSLPA